jgi:hypothetical protein
MTMAALNSCKTTTVAVLFSMLLVRSAYGAIPLKKKMWQLGQDFRKDFFAYRFQGREAFWFTGMLSQTVFATHPPIVKQCFQSLRPGSKIGLGYRTTSSVRTTLYPRTKK